VKTKLHFLARAHMSFINSPRTTVGMHAPYCATLQYIIFFIFMLAFFNWCGEMLLSFVSHCAINIDLSGDRCVCILRAADRFADVCRSCLHVRERVHVAASPAWLSCVSRTRMFVACHSEKWCSLKCCVQLWLRIVSWISPNVVLTHYRSLSSYRGQV